MQCRAAGPVGAGGEFVVEQGGLPLGDVGAQQAHGVQLRVDAFDVGDRVLQGLHGRDLAAKNGVGQGEGVAREPGRT